MQTTNLFEQIARGMGDPKKFGQWFPRNWPATAAEDNAPAQAWVHSIESWLQGAESLRNMQLAAIHNTQQRTTRLAQSLGKLHDQNESARALQTYAQENLTEALKYWSAFNEIVRDAEFRVLGDAAKAGSEAVAGAAKQAPARRRKKLPVK